VTGEVPGKRSFSTPWELETSGWVLKMQSILEKLTENELRSDQDSVKKPNLPQIGPAIPHRTKAQLDSTDPPVGSAIRSAFSAPQNRSCYLAPFRFR
jgi:hypothetical protein